MSDFIFRIQPNIVLGSYTTSRLGQYIRDYGSKFMVIIDPILKQVGNAEKITNTLTDRKIDFFT
ncbi:MAG: iron-containing alcohol dehydrogenase, partial [Treponema sp.]|nr:iron-containing alcohol dehydrogenase [Treponema sp.]